MSSYSLPVLLYHRVVNNQSKTGKHKLYVFENKFRQQMQFLKERGYTTLTFDDLNSSKLSSSTLEKKIILTFDDGYEDNYTILFPILKEFGFTAVIYLVTGQAYNAWALAEGEPQLNMMSHHMIREMSEYGIEFGGHTRTHANLKNTSAKLLSDEIAGCKTDVEKITGKSCISFAYPFGAHNETVEKVVRNAGYKYGISTIFGPQIMKEDLMRIRRIEIRPCDSLARFKYKASGFYFQKSYLNYLLS